MIPRPSSVTLPYAQGRIVPINLAGSRKNSSYDIVIGDTILTDAGELIKRRFGVRRCIIVTDSQVAELYCQRLEAILAESGHILLPPVIVPAGEASKNYRQLEKVLEHILSAHADRKTMVIALGGGMIGDLAGLAASLALRGLDCVQIPSTLLAQVDSSVGGKTAVNAAAGKNTVGTFSQPCLVISDVSLLDSLPHREFLSGYAEVVKYGLIKDPDFFSWCKAHAGKLLNGDREAQIYAIGVSCQHKAAIVAADERESGERALLNLGHTFGHALETTTGYGNVLTHGEAVAIGMVMAFKLSAQMGLCPHADAYEVREHLEAVGLPVVPPPYGYDVDQLMTLMAQDKKALGGKLTLILTRGIGQAFVSHDVNEKEVRDVWETFLPKASSTV